MATLKIISEILKKTDMSEVKTMISELKKSGNLTELEEKVLANTFQNKRNHMIGDSFIKFEEKLYESANKFAALPKEVRKYSSEELRILDIQIEEGNSIAQLAEMRNITPSSMRRVLELNGRQTLESRLLSSITDDELVKLVKEGRSSKEIAEYFGLDHAGALTPRLKRLDLNATQAKIKSISDADFQQAFREGFSVQELADKLKVSPQYVYQRYKELGLVREIFSPTPNQIKLVQNYLRDGVPRTDIAKRLGINVQQISVIISENNLKTSRELLFDSLPKGENLKSIVKLSLNWSDLLKELKCDKNMAIQLLESEGIKFIPPEIPKIKILEVLILKHPDITVNRISQMLKLSPEVTYKILKKHSVCIGGLKGSRYFSGKAYYIRTHFLDLVRQGKSLKQIAKEMKMPEYGVISEIKEYIADAKIYGYKDADIFVNYLKSV